MHSSIAWVRYGRQVQISLPTHINVGKNGVGAERQNACNTNPDAFLTKRDFAEAIKAVMNGEIQGDHYGVQVAMKLEGSTISFSRNQAPNELIEDNLVTSSPKIYFAHFSDDGSQSCETSYYNFTKQLEYLQEKDIYKPNTRHIFYDNTDGCTEQYRCSKAVYLMTTLASTYKIVIDRLIHPLHMVRMR